MVFVALAGSIAVLWQWRRADAERQRAEFGQYVNQIKAAQLERVANELQRGGPRTGKMSGRFPAVGVALPEASMPTGGAANEVADSGTRSERSV